MDAASCVCHPARTRTHGESPAKAFPLERRTAHVLEPTLSVARTHSRFPAGVCFLWWRYKEVFGQLTSFGVFFLLAKPRGFDIATASNPVWERVGVRGLVSSVRCIPPSLPWTCVGNLRQIGGKRLFRHLPIQNRRITAPSAGWVLIFPFLPIFSIEVTVGNTPTINEGATFLPV